MRISLLVLLLASGAAAQDKSPGTATLLSAAVPGGGQLYAGETVKGAVLLGVAAVGAGVAVSAVDRQTCTGFGCASEFETFYEVDGTRLAAGLGIAGAAWLIGVVDAPGAARRANRRADLAVAPRLGGGATVSLRVGL
jgi:TM2 domain-containing membrane protein YozV